MRKIQLANQEYYHIFNRGVDKRDIFLGENDFWRFYVSLFLFNDMDFKALRGLGTFPQLSCGSRHSLAVEKVSSPNERKPLVDILSFCLIPNHYHLYLKQLIENGISLFMQRLNQGYTNYFNIKNERSGSLFEGPFRAVHIGNERQFLHIPRYIHLNVADIIEPDWREKGIKDWKKTLKFLENYKWSSHNVYLGKPQELKVVNPEAFKKIFKTPEQYLEFLKSWAVKDWEKTKEYCLE